jgi:hypothetical protein
MCVLLRIGAAPAVGVRPCIWLPTRPRSAHYGRETRAQNWFLVVFGAVRDLLLCAKHLFVAAILAGPPASRPISQRNGT